MGTAGSTASLLDAGEGRELLRIARESVERFLEAGGDPDAGAPPLSLTGRLAERRGVFVTLTVAGQLRGCTGYVEGHMALVEAVRDLAVSSASRDRRFQPIRRDELVGLHVEVSVLTPPRPIRREEIEIGRHGLIVRMHGRSGLLLPQVAPEWGWDLHEFVEHTCQKAGLPRDAWKSPDCSLLGFEAQIFEET